MIEMIRNSGTILVLEKEWPIREAFNNVLILARLYRAHMVSPELKGIGKSETTIEYDILSLFALMSNCRNGCHSTGQCMTWIKKRFALTKLPARQFDFIICIHIRRKSYLGCKTFKLD